jgi:dTDP-4-amino-4,6-dideoxygalactose transaminase
MTASPAAIPLVGVARQYEALRAEIEPVVHEVLASGRYILGPKLKEFEERFAAYCGAKFAIGASSGTTALHLALLAVGVGPGDEVITVPNSFIATAEAVSHCGAKPVFVDVFPDTMNMRPDLVAARITKRTKAILPVHLHGQPADMDPILEIARAHGLKVVEDAAQAHGAEYKGRRAGSLADAACFSFHPAKVLHAAGDAGLVTTSDPAIAERVRMLADHGRSDKYLHRFVGFNYRMDPLQAAVLTVKLPHLDGWLAARRRHAARYAELLAGATVECPVAAPFARHVYQVYVIQLDNRDAVRQALATAGIESGVHYPVPLHLQPAYRSLGYRKGEFPAAEHCADRMLSIPMFPELTEAEVERVAAVVREAAP